MIKKEIKGIGKVKKKAVLQFHNIKYRNKKLAAGV
jgi:hypothetical protein